jgi:osmotically-inducible protein OsmY
MARRWREDYRGAGTGWRPAGRPRDWEHASDERSSRGRGYGPAREFGTERSRWRGDDEGDDSESYRRVGPNRGYIGGEPNQGYVGFGPDQGFWRSPPREQGYESGYPEQEQRYGRGRGRDYEGRGERSWWDRASDEVASWVGDEDAQRRRDMDEMRSHRGRGPRGYTRSDDRIKEDVNDRLTDHPMIDASDIEVAVSSCEVTLSGTVDSRAAKRFAEDIAEDVSGVRHVQNNLRVQVGRDEGELTTTGNPMSAGRQRVRSDPE